MTPLTLDDLEWATALLSDAFLDRPPATHLFQGPDRASQTRYFMRCSCLYALLFGEAYTDAARSGVALWLPPGSTSMTPARMYRAGMLSAPFRLGIGAFARFMAFARHANAMHARALSTGHYHLFALGVSPQAQGRGVGRALALKMLERIDAERRIAYLETQSEPNVALYRSLGFEVAATAPFPRLGGLCNWAMVRPAKTR